MATTTFDVVYGTRTVGVPLPYLSIRRRRPPSDAQPAQPLRLDRPVLRTRAARSDRSGAGLPGRRDRSRSAQALHRALDARAAATDRAMAIRAGSGF